MRKFWLKNEAGTRKGLNGDDTVKVFFSNPAGLGVSYKNSLAEIGEGFFARTTRSVNQPKITGDMVFTSATPYADWLTIANFIETANQLYFEYSPVTGVTYTRRISVSDLVKGEIGKGGWLSIKATFNCLTPWYTEQTMTGNSISVTEGGQIGAAVLLSITGSITTETIVMTDTDGEFMRCELSSDTAITTLEYSNLYDDSHVYATISGTTSDATNLVTPNMTLYGHNKGKAFTLTVSSGTVSALVRKYWRTV